MHETRSGIQVVARAQERGLCAVLHGIITMRSHEGDTMKKSEDADFQEMFGSSTVAESLNADAPLNHGSFPDVPTDSAMWNFLDDPLGKAGEQIADQALIAEISGFDSAVQPLVAEPDTASLESNVFEKVVEQTATILEGIPRHRAAMELICSRLKKSPVLLSTKDDPTWDRLAEAMTKFTTTTIFAGCR
jgi:hypothetical protein